jgi:hypothetical protein
MCSKRIDIPVSPSCIRQSTLLVTIARGNLASKGFENIVDGDRHGIRFLGTHC